MRRRTTRKAKNNCENRSSFRFNKFFCWSNERQSKTFRQNKTKMHSAPESLFGASPFRCEPAKRRQTDFRSRSHAHQICMRKGFFATILTWVRCSDALFRVYIPLWTHTIACRQPNEMILLSPHPLRPRRHRHRCCYWKV